MKKHREKHRPLFITFLDLEQAFERVPHELIWYALRQHLLSEELVCWIKLLYHDPKVKVQSLVGDLKPLRVSAGVHQESALLPPAFLFLMVVSVGRLQKTMKAVLQ